MRKTVRIDRGAGRQAMPARQGVPQSLPAKPAEQTSALGQGCGVVLVIVLFLVLLGKCSAGPTDTSDALGQSSLSAPAYVAARSLNCRSRPDASASVAAGLVRNEQVTVAERRGDWSRLTWAGGDCWVSSPFLADVPSGDGTVAGTPSSGAQGLMSSGVGGMAAVAGGSYAAGKAAKASRKKSGAKRRSGSRSRRGSGGGYGDAGCPCSGSQVCIGPRGGRYCITSGGNKRYGV